MKRILDHRTEPTTVQTKSGDKTVDQVREVTYIDDNGAVHTLTFHPAGTNVAGEAEGGNRIVGEDTPHYGFTDPREAVNAYENGEVI